MNPEDTPASRRRLIEDLERRAAEDQAEHAGMSIVDEQKLQSTLRRGCTTGVRHAGTGYWIKPANFGVDAVQSGRITTGAKCVSMAKPLPGA